MNANTRSTFAALSTVLGLSCSRSPEATAPIEPRPSIAQTARPASPSPALSSVLIEGVPHVRQRPDFCGEACISMALAKLGRPLDQDEVFARSGVDPALGRGAFTKEMQAALTGVGFDPGPVWRQVEAARADAGLEAEWKALHDDLRAGIPSIVCMHYSDKPETTEHFRLVLGYDAARDEVVYHEPAEDDGAYRRMPRTLFLKLWPLKYNAETWTVIRMRMAPRDLSLAAPAPPRPGFSPAAFAQHVMALKSKIDRLDGRFTVIVEPPFVVIGDGEPSAVRASSERTVRWATAKLKQDFFTKDPERILDVWLFKDAASYNKNARALFGETPSTPYGWYSSRHGALVMNISTGGGTLVHEIVHPFVEANVPNCPPWLNEGLGSLYEQSGDEQGHIHGYTNWRLRGLKEAVREGSVPPFAELLAMDENAFYDRDRGTNYAQSRYLLYYLQEKGLLLRFYREFMGNRAADPTGYGALRRVLGEDDMEGFKRRWEKFVLGLSFP
jgi:hypothetical protein